MKIYQADAFKHDEMNVEAEKFRKITMKVLTMQLNSIIIMDLIAYGGAALGVIMAATQLRAGKIDLAGALLIILLAADFFIPMRQLGSFFHIAMNGMAASDKIFRLLDLPEPEQSNVSCPDGGIVCHDLHFSYEPERETLHGVDLTIPQGKFVSLVGESGCGKSTISALLMGRDKGYTGSVTIGGAELRDISEHSLMQNITYVSHQSYLFKGTVRDYLRMGQPGVSDDELWNALTQVNLADFLKREAGLDTLPSAARTSPAASASVSPLPARCCTTARYTSLTRPRRTSTWRVRTTSWPRSHALAGRKTVLLISHGLANVTASDEIYVLDRGNIVQHGTHDALLKQGGAYAALWSAQQALVQRGELTFDGALIAVLALFSSFGPTVALANLGATLQNTFAAGNRVLDILDEEPVANEVAGQPDVSFTGAEAEHVTFSYGGEDILSDVSVSFPEGSVVGIVGPQRQRKVDALKAPDALLGRVEGPRPPVGHRRFAYQHGEPPGHGELCHAGDPFVPRQHQK